MSALGILRSFAEARCADHEPIPARLTYGTIREALRLIEGRGYQTGSLAGALELTPGYRISIPLTHVDGPEERELLRRRHPPHPDIPRNLIAQGWFESGYDTAALEFWDVVHEANRELAARDAEIERLTAALEQFKKEVSWARDKLAARVSSLEAELAERRERVADRRGAVAAAELVLRELQESALLGAEGRIGLLRGGLDQIRLDAKHGAAPDALAAIASHALDEDAAAAALAQEHPTKVAAARAAVAEAQERLQSAQAAVAEAERAAAQLLMAAACVDAEEEHG